MPSKKENGAPLKKMKPALKPIANSHEESAREVLRRFRIVFSTVRKHFQDVESKCGVSGAQLWAISEIVDTPGIRVTELACAMSVHQSTASNLVGELEKSGLIKKERGPDQRVVRLYLTGKGDELIARAPKPMMGVLPDALQRLPNEALESLATNLDVLIETMQLKDKTAAGKPLSDI